MRLDALHHRVIMDARVLQSAVSSLLTADIPREYDGRTFNISAFCKRLNTLTEPHGIYHVVTNDKLVPPGTIEMEATWYSEDETRSEDTTADILVNWCVHPKAHRVTLSPVQWVHMVQRFWFYIQHEICHRHQNVHRQGGAPIEPEHPDYKRARVYRARSTKAKIRDEQEYLGDYDEIEAYAHGAAFEMIVWYPKIGYRNALAKIANETNGLGANARGIPTFKWYMSYFSDSPNHPAIAIFKRKVAMWYKMMALDADFYQSLELEPQG